MALWGPLSRTLHKEWVLILWPLTFQYFHTLHKMVASLQEQVPWKAFWASSKWLRPKPAASERSIAQTGLPLPGAPVEGKLSLTLYKEWVLNLLATGYLFSIFYTFASFRYSFYAFRCFNVYQHCYGGALVLRTQGEQPCEPSHTGQDTYFIARDT